LTTVDVPSVEVGRRAVEMLTATVRDGRSPASEIMPVELVIGESTPRRAPSARRHVAPVAAGARRGMAS
jgi:DNA-binding LacI/PurR family transcriptional regulator